jgi:hypothetical protein
MPFNRRADTVLSIYWDEPIEAAILSGWLWEDEGDPIRYHDYFGLWIAMNGGSFLRD